MIMRTVRMNAPLNQIAPPHHAARNRSREVRLSAGAGRGIATPREPETPSALAVIRLGSLARDARSIASFDCAASTSAVAARLAPVLGQDSVASPGTGCP